VQDRDELEKERLSAEFLLADIEHKFNTTDSSTRQCSSTRQYDWQYTGSTHLVRLLDPLQIVLREVRGGGGRRLCRKTGMCVAGAVLLAAAGLGMAC
jgi:hypothetical protein